ncbi:MAG TPA: hypothetical protein VFE22_03985, partial [Edaphobacter sp.]|nr:hypothetical protein [Edaphobacter sp.]
MPPPEDSSNEPTDAPFGEGNDKLGVPQEKKLSNVDAARVVAVISHFAADGLATKEYLRAAGHQPQLFRQKPSTLIANIEGVVSHFAADGLTKKEYLNA